MSNLRVVIGHGVLSGWKNVNIHQSIDQMCGSFSISTSESIVGVTVSDISGTQNFTTEIQNGDLCKLEIGKGDNYTTVITGYIDDIDNSYDAREHTITLRGRDIMCDLVDCSYYPRFLKNEYKNEWTDSTAENLINEICDPFNVEVVTDKTALTPATEPIPKFKIKDGETAAESIKRICRYKGILAISKGDGKLYLTQAGEDLTDGGIELGYNVKRGRSFQSNKERFSHYIVKGKGKSESVQLFGIDINVRAIISDEIIQSGKGYYSDPAKPTQRFRPRVFLSDMVTNFTVNPVLEKIRLDVSKGSETRKTYSAVTLANQRGEQEARVRAGNSRRLEYTVQGWMRNEKNEPWALNTLTTVKDNMLNVRGNYLIKDIRFRLDQNRGSETDLILVHKDAYKVVQKALKEIKTDNDNLFTAQFRQEYFDIP